MIQQMALQSAILHLLPPLQHLPFLAPSSELAFPA